MIAAIFVLPGTITQAPETFSCPEGRIEGHGPIVAGQKVDRKVVCKTAE
jgi:hypothetical protein